jgi:PAS domain S-box-containing protein
MIPVTRSVLLRSIAAVVLTAAATMLQVLFLRHIGIEHPFIIFYAAVTMAALYLELEGGVTATVTSVLAVIYLWIEPTHMLSIRRTEDMIYVAIFFIEGLIISYAADGMRRAKVLQAQASVLKKLQESERRLRLALDGGQMGMWSWDMATNSAELNDQEYELLGLPKGDGQESTDRIFSSVHPDDVQKFKRVLDEVLERGEVFAHEFRIVRPDGEIRWLAARAQVLRDASGTATRMVGVNYDITSRRLMVEELRKVATEARARAEELAVLMDTVPAITFIAHDPECRSMSSSRKSRELLRVPQGKSVSMSAPEEERPNSFSALKDGKELAPDELPLQIAAKGHEVRNFEFTLVFEDGSSSDVFGDAVPLFDETGKVRGAIGAFLDITEYKKIQLGLQKAHDELEQRVAERTAQLHSALESLTKETEERLQIASELRVRDLLLMQQSRLAAMGEMVGNIAHQWRQPLNVLGLIVQELPLMYSAGKFSEEYLKAQMTKAKELIFHMSQTIEDFRNFFRPSVDCLEFKARDMITTTLSLVEDTLKNSQIEVVVEESGDPTIYGVPSQCSQVLLNILLNSRDAFLERGEQKPWIIRVATFMEDGKTLVTIADNAGGIPEEILGNIFDSFFTTKGPEKGTGIGLFMAKNIIEKLNGRLTVRNIEDGVEFRIEVSSNAPS